MQSSAGLLLLSETSPRATVTPGPSNLWTPAATGAKDRLRWDFRDADSVTSTSGKMSRIANKGSLGSAGDLLQADASRQPSYSAGLMTTDNGGEWVSTADLTFSSVFSTQNSGIIYGIVQYRGGVVWFKWQEYDGNRLGMEGDSRIDWQNDNAGILQYWSQNLSNTPKLLVLHKTPTVLNARINGQLVGTRDVNLVIYDFTRPLTLGAGSNNGDYQSLVDFRSAFGIIDDYADDTVAKTEGYLAWKEYYAGVTTYVDALPAGHTYKNSPPMVASAVVARRRPIFVS